VCFDSGVMKIIETTRCEHAIFITRRSLEHWFRMTKLIIDVIRTGIISEYSLRVVTDFQKSAISMVRTKSEDKVASGCGR
jgi:hypothetical protein